MEADDPIKPEPPEPEPEPEPAPAPDRDPDLDRDRDLDPAPAPVPARPRITALAALLGGTLAILLLTAPFAWRARRSALADVPPPPPPVRHDVPDASELVELTVDAGVAEAAVVPPPRAFRVSDLSGDSRLELLEGTIGKRPLLAALQTAGLAPKEAQRVLHAFDGVKNMDRLAVKDTFVVARDKASGHAVAFELAASPSDVWQARENEDGKLVGKKLELFVEHRRVDAAFAVLGDLRSSLTSAKLDEDLLEKIDDAIDGHAELSDLKPGVRLRVIATEERVEGTFVGYSSLDAVEYLPVGRPSLRVYYWDRGAVDPKKDHAKTGSGFYDDKGRQPFHGGWRSPVPGARISSRFNPNRMHPVLHVVMPHNGIDFAAPSGTPIYAAASGVVRSAGDSGPCGNMVMIDHPNGLTTAYCHMSKFAPGMHAGLHVETRQLVGYVGQTGRATGPHLHFAVKRGDIFLDPMILKLDGVRVVPPKERGAFDERRTALDAELDAIPLPDAESSGDGGTGDDDGGAEVYLDDPH